MKTIENKSLKTEEDLLKVGADLLQKNGEHKLYEIYPTCYIVENQKVIHSYQSLPQRRK
ncbi:hypothetical protein ISS08_01220 [Candidatus Pacearchaeota archaeon]|nr:hypothetical protein [Candidatus Pacearchaeota archaeon]